MSLWQMKFGDQAGDQSGSLRRRQEDKRRRIRDESIIINLCVREERLGNFFRWLTGKHCTTEPFDVNASVNSLFILLVMLRAPISFLKLYMTLLKLSFSVGDPKYIRQ
jgi:hypothetical protein